MFEAAKRSAEARASVQGPRKGPAPETPPLDPNRPLTPLRPQALADFACHVISATVVLPVAVLETRRWWSTVGLVVGLAFGTTAIWSALRGSRHLRSAEPAGPGASYETARRAVGRGVRGAWFVAGQALLYTLIWVGDDTGFATVFAALLVPATIGSGLTLWSIVSAERAFGEPLAHHAVSGRELTLSDPISIRAAYIPSDGTPRIGAQHPV